LYSASVWVATDVSKNKSNRPQCIVTPSSPNMPCYWHSSMLAHCIAYTVTPTNKRTVTHNRCVEATIYLGPGAGSAMTRHPLSRLSSLCLAEHLSPRGCFCLFIYDICLRQQVRGCSSTQVRDLIQWHEPLKTTWPFVQDEESKAMAEGKG
jgi:hypothetical protein